MVSAMMTFASLRKRMPSRGGRIANSASDGIV